MSKAALTEFLEDVKLEIGELDEAAKAAGFIATITGVGMNAGRITANDTLYPRALVKEQIGRVNPLMTEGKFLGLYGHYEGEPGVAIRWTSCRMDAAWDVVFEGGILDTRAGRDLAGVLRGGAKSGLSTAGYGSTKEIEMGPDHPDWELNKTKQGAKCWEIQDDYEMRRLDAVLHPSNKDAWTESEKTEIVKRLEAAAQNLEDDTMEIKTLDDLKKAVSEDVYNAIVQAVTEMVKPDIVAEDEEARATELAAKLDEAVAEAFKDQDKLAEACGCKPEVVKFAAENFERLTKMHEMGWKLPDIDALLEGGKPDPESDGADTRVEELQAALDEEKAEREKLQARVQEMADEKAEAERKLFEKEQRSKLEAKVDALTAGEPGGGLVAEDAVDLLAEGLAELKFEGDDAEETEKKIKATVETVRERHKAIREGATAPRPRGQENRGEADANDKIVAEREKFAKDYPHLARPGQTARIGARNRGKDVLKQWDACFGPEAVESCPLD